MSTSDRNEFAALIEAHAGRGLTRGEEQRLRALAAADQQRAAELAALDDVHELLDAERELLQRAVAPTTSAEEADEGFQRLAAAAASAEGDLRARLRHPVAPSTGARLNRRRGWFLGLAAAVILAGLAFVLSGRGPDLLGDRPDNAVLGGGARIVLRAELSARRPELSWHEVVGASRYDAVVEDAEDRVVLQRAPERAGSTVWQLTSDEFGVLRERRDAGVVLRLRIVARDRSGLAVASSGDLPLQLVD